MSGLKDCGSVTVASGTEGGRGGGGRERRKAERRKGERSDRFHSNICGECSR